MFFSSYEVTLEAIQARKEVKGATLGACEATSEASATSKVEIVKFCGFFEILAMAKVHNTTLVSGAC